jgi:plasmid stabilization system protein ParE
VTRHVDLRSFVPADILETVAYIDRQSVERGSRFAGALAETLDWLAENANSGSPKQFDDEPGLTGFRSWQVRGFRSHLILYRVHPAGLRCSPLSTVAATWRRSCVCELTRRSDA